MTPQANQPSADVPEGVQASWLWSLKRFRTSMQPDDLLRTLITEPHFRTWLASLADRQAREEARDGGGWGHLGEHHTIAHDGFTGTVIGSYVTAEGKRGVVMQQDGTRVVHVYGEKWLPAIEPSPVEGDRR